ncbi:TPA: hypothetical protein SG818_001906 [Campylobacter coli]|nr:hypothetical protein [Campylobacter coli]
MKKISLGAIVAFSLMNVSVSAIDLSEFTFTGDTKLSCEAVLCLASPYKPSECAPALARYFGFSAKYWSDVIRMRTNFLNLCPLGANNAIKSDDKELEAWRNSLVNLTGTCYIPDLNKKQQRTILWVEDKRCTHGDGCTTVKINHYGFRIDPNLDNNCKILSSNKYSDYNLKYTCPTKFYPEEDWNNGYEKKEVNQSEFNSLKEEDRFTADKLTEVSYSEYKNLPNNKRKISTSGFKTTYYRIDLGYYKKEWINKNCWINENKK